MGERGREVYLIIMGEFGILTKLATPTWGVRLLKETIDQRRHDWV